MFFLRAKIHVLMIISAVLFLGGSAVHAQTPSYPQLIEVYASSHTQLDISWEPFGASATDFEIFRDGMSVGTTTAATFSDTGLMPGSAHVYRVTGRNASGSSAQSPPVVGTTRTLDGSFVMDGWADFDRYKIQPGGSCDCGDVADLGIWAAIRGRTLYVATRTIPPGGQYDYFILVNAASYFQSPAPWGKTGTIPFQTNQPFIGVESTNDYVGWFNAPASAQVVRAAHPGGVIEGTIDLVETFGYVPGYVSIIVLAYQTWDGGHLVAQSPWGDKDDFVGSNEVRSPMKIMLQDEDQDGLYDRIDPAKGWRITSIVRESDGTTTVTVPAVPRRNFSLQISDNGPNGPFWNYSGATGTDWTPFVSINDRSPVRGQARYYRVRLDRY